jgi:retinol dehydrogenase 12
MNPSDSSGLSDRSNYRLHNRVALVTGANTGIGLVTARELARAGARVFIACRTPANGQAALERIRMEIGHSSQIETLTLDLGDFASVRRCAAEFLAKDLPLHILVNNAGLAGQRGLTTSGFELAFGVNHLGHFLLTNLLLERLRASAPARIVTVASRAHTRSSGLDWAACQKSTATRFALKEYADSKLANVLFSAELGRRLQTSGVSTFALHPGVVASDIWRKIPWPFSSLIKRRMITTDEGAKTSLYCASAPEPAGDTGLYYDKCTVREPSALGRDLNLAAELWQRSEEWTKAFSA